MGGELRRSLVRRRSGDAGDGAYSGRFFSPLSIPGVEQSVDHFDELFAFEGLAEVIVHARFQADVAVALDGIRRQGDDGNMALARDPSISRRHIRQLAS